MASSTVVSPGARVVARPVRDVTAGPAVTSRTGLATTLAPGDTTVELALQVDQPHLWDLNDPYLYRVTLRSQAEIDGEVVEDEYTLRCGFRDFRVERGFFRLNGRRIFVRSTHTGDHYPQGQEAPVDPDLVRRDLIMARAAGFNMVRFISGVALPDQLGFADELGLLVYEENMAAWGLLNETVDGPDFRHAVDYLPRLRTLDPTRLVLLSSGRWDCQWQI